jgi:hypothetical protein
VNLLHAHLQAMRARLEDLGRWTAGAMARDSHHRPVMPSHPDARCWCLLGAYYAEVDKYDDAEQSDARRYVAVSLLRALNSAAARLYNDRNGLQHLNDEYGHVAALAVITDALRHPPGERCAARHASGRCVRDVHLDDRHVSLALEPGQRAASWRDADTMLLGTD